PSPSPCPPLWSRRTAFAAILRVAGDALCASGWPLRCAVHAADHGRPAQCAELLPAARPAPLAQPLRLRMGCWGYAFPCPCARVDNARGNRG
ncbi:hypothetical protein FB107DRAFT_196242, partial [Schizophyllum commune]